MEVRKIGIVTNELVGYAKTSGLADEPAALAKTYAGLGWEVKIFIPRYKGIDRSN
jgi:glycogen synthase